MAIACTWRGDATDRELNVLHAEAFGTRVYGDDEWGWHARLHGHSLGWVTARDGDALVGFVNIVWDGLVHAWIQDTMVAERARHRGIATALVAHAVEGSRAAGCEWLHVDFEHRLRAFYIETCGFTPTSAGLIEL